MTVAAPCTLPWSLVYDASFSNDVDPASTQSAAAVSSECTTPWTISSGKPAALARRDDP